MKGRGILIFLLLFIFFLAFLNLRLFGERKKIEKKVENLKNEIEILNQKKAEFEKKLSKLKTKIFWEERAREQGYIKEGEEPIIIKFK